MTDGLQQYRMPYDEIKDEVKNMPETIDSAVITVSYDDSNQQTYMTLNPVSQSDPLLSVPRKGFTATIPTRGFDTYRQFLEGYDWK